MKAVIFAGGRGTRIAEETGERPKPMIEIGGLPLLWHIMKYYDHHGVRDFVVCLGYKGHIIKKYFLDYYLHNANLRIDLGRGTCEALKTHSDDWRVTLVDTGLETGTGGRLRRVREHLDGEAFCLTYGDGLSTVDFGAELAYHRAHGKLATVASVRPHGRYGVLVREGTRVKEFREKSADEVGWINGGFFILEPGVFDYIDDDTTMWEQEPLARLAADGQLHAYEHEGFWFCCDTLRDKLALEKLWAERPPWRIWS